MNFLYTTDLHGFEWKYDQLLNYAIKNNIDLIINGGDCLPKNNPIHTEQQSFLENFLLPHFENSNNNKINYLIMLGNDDLKIYDNQFQELINQFTNVKNIANHCIQFDKYEFIGFNLVKDAPFLLKDRFRRDEIEDTESATEKGILSSINGFNEINWKEKYLELASLEEELDKLPNPKDYSNTVYVIHQPPASISMATIFGQKDVGSSAVKNFLEKFQPRLSLHGHIHESFKVGKVWKSNIGKTICIQPGQEDDFIIVKGNIDEQKYERVVIPWKNNFYINRD
jgi:Icc-related predicted phosphoesterase